MATKTSKLVIGTAQFGLDYGISNKFGKTDPEEVSKILDFAVEQKIKLLDTAHGYGNSEEVLGGNDLEKFRIISKFPSTEEINNVLKLSLQRLSVDSIYGFLSHDSRQLIDSKDVWEKLCTLKDSRLVEKIGYSIYYPSELEQLLENGFIPDIVQIPFNILDNRFQVYFNDLKKYGTEIHTRSAFLQGLFFCDIEKLDPFFNVIKPTIRALRNDFPEKFEMMSYLLNYCIDIEEVDKVVVGVESLEQLKEIVRSIDSKRSPIGLSFDLSNEIKEHHLIPSNWPVII